MGAVFLRKKMAWRKHKDRDRQDKRGKNIGFLSVTEQL